MSNKSNASPGREALRTTVTNDRTDICSTVLSSKCNTKVVCNPIVTHVLVALLGYLLELLSPRALGYGVLCAWPDFRRA